MSEDPHIWTDDALARLLGARDGYIGSLLTVRAMIRQFDSQYTGRFPLWQTRKIAARDAITAPLREVEKMLVERVRSCGEAYEKQIARSASAKADRSVG